MTADTGLCPLSHFDFNSGTGFKVILVDTKTSARYLNNSVFTVNIEILVQTTFACVVKNTKLGGCTGKRGVGIVTDKAVTHS